MSTVGSEHLVLRHPRLASLATREWPAWLWAADGSRILWANAVGAAIFGAATINACAKRRFSAADPVAAQVIRLAPTLPSNGQERLERLRGFGGNFGRALTCACSRMVTDDGHGAVLIAATQPAGPALTLAERVRRLFTDNEEALAAFLPDGQLLFANAAGQKRLAGTGSLGTLGFRLLADKALQDGSAGSTTRLDGNAFDVVAARLGEDGNYVVLFSLQVAGTAPAAPEPLDGTPPASDPDASPQTVIAAQSASPPQRRHPLRFVWDMDADGRFAVASDEFIQLVGPHTALFGRPWREIATTLRLDPDDQVARAVASRETWSGITVAWPVGLDKSADLRLPIVLSGLPVFDRDRNFRGYRGFGVCRAMPAENPTPPRQRQMQSSVPIGDVAAIRSAMDSAMASRMSASINTATSCGMSNVPLNAAASSVDRASEREPAAPIAAPTDGASLERDPELANVVPFRPASAQESNPAPGLTPVERRAFRELAQELTSRLGSTQATAPAEIVDIEDPVAATRAQAQRATTLSPQELEHLLIQALNQEPSEQLDPAAKQRPGEPTSEAPAAETTAAVPIADAPEQALPKTAGQLAGPDRQQSTESKRDLPAAVSKAEFVAKIGHEIRTPMTAIAGLAEVMMAERFGPIGNERYREHIKDIHAASAHLSATLNDLLDLSRIETGRTDLTFANVNLNDLIQQCVGIMQPQANRARIIIRSALTSSLPLVMADERALRQIVLNLLSNSIGVTGPGGQIIISTVYSETHDAVLRVRDTGSGMSEREIAAALQPFREIGSAASWGSGETGFGLPLTKALAEANHAHFRIKSAPDAGTLIEVAFPPHRLIAA
jgi:signal transduction histidine kinase